MSLSLGVGKEGRLILDESAQGEAGFDGENERELREVLAKQGDAAVAVWLAGKLPSDGLPAVALWWRKVAGWYLTAFCRGGGEGGVAKPMPDQCQVLLEQAPAMLGAEFLGVETLKGFWQRLDEWIKAQVALHPRGAEGWLKERLPHWRLVGRVTLHLAENRKNLESPFAFLATYTNGLNEEGKPRHVPLQQALLQHAGGKDQAALLRLLEPLKLAAEQSEVMCELLDSKAIYRPQAWSPGQALAFLREAEVLQRCGLALRIPDWWKAKIPRRLQVSVKVGESIKRDKQSRGGMLDLDVAIALDGEKLSEAELQALRTAQGLSLVKGKWVEVDAEKLQAVLKHWQRARVMQYQGGMSFLQAMRLISGVPQMMQDGEALPEEVVRQWTRITAGGEMEARLSQMRDPALIEAEDAPPDLRASLRPYQQVGVRWLRRLTSLGLGACLADDMGLGKTVQLLALLLQMKRCDAAEDRGVTLLVAPASLLPNWQAEAAKFAPSLQVLVAHASADDPKRWQRWCRGEKQRQRDEVDLVLTTYGMVARVASFKEIEWRLVVLDEAQTIKNAESIQARAVKQLPAMARVALTGTPVENRLGDLWSLFDFLNPGLLGSAAVFQRWVKAMSRGEGTDFGPLRQLLRPYILRRLKTDKKIISDLPDKVEMVSWCLMTRPQAVLYQQTVENLMASLAEVDREGRNGLVLSALTKLKQICGHPAQHSGDAVYETQLSGKFLRLKELCETFAERQERMLVFTQFTEVIPALRGLMREVFRRDGLVLTGSTPVKERRQLVETFQRADGPPFFILSLKAGGTGLTLTEASQVVHFDRWWNPAVENQATDRAYRIGQKNKVLVHKLVCKGTLEEKIDRLIESKKQLAAELLADTENRAVTDLSDAELLQLVSLEVSQVSMEEE